MSLPSRFLGLLQIRVWSVEQLQTTTFAQVSSFSLNSSSFHLIFCSQSINTTFRFLHFRDSELLHCIFHLHWSGVIVSVDLQLLRSSRCHLLQGQLRLLNTIHHLHYLFHFVWVCLRLSLFLWTRHGDACSGRDKIAF